MVADKRDRNRPLVWFHAPSVGEGLQARPIIDALRAARPDVQIAYSFFSPSAESFAKSLNVDFAECLPFDSVGDAQALIEVLAPTALFFVKLDVWPNFVRVAKARGVIVGMISATVAPQSGRQGVIAQTFLRDAYAALDVVGAIDSQNGQRLSALGVPANRLSVSGDTRFDQVRARADRADESSALLRALKSDRPTLIAGSTWPSDESVLLPAWKDIKASVTNARLIIAPHEPTAAHLNPIQNWAASSGLSCNLLREVEQNFAKGIADATDVIIVDRVGVLGDIYAIADVAFVGGAFHKAGLHSVLEPAAFGKPVVFGPTYTMSREAGLMLERHAAQSVSNAEACARVITEWFSNENARSQSGDRANTFVQSELGAAERSLALVLRAIGQ
ncbi:MAG: glycosyltransferase N-terminal domain-containing protein [Gemmatimonadaceae bacterium]